MEYYKELGIYKNLEESVNDFGKSLGEKRSGCFHHRVEHILSVLISSATNKTLIKNKIFNYVEQSSFDTDVKEYLKYFISQVVDENTIYKCLIPKSLSGVIKGNEVYDLSMVEGYNNLEISNMNNDIFKLIEERTELKNFLSVPAPDILHKNAFWRDENNLPIDCNIYHPKYGYPGFESPYDNVVASFQPVTIYQDPKTRNYIYCQSYLPMLCTADQVNFTNKDGKKVVKVDYLQSHQTRLADNQQDFETIFHREFKSKNLNGTPEIIKVFRFELISHIEHLVKQHTEISSYKDGRDINVLALANSFIDFLKSAQPQPIVKPKPELKIDQIALKYAYEGLQITRENGNEIAKEYGHNSGEKLFQRFTHFSSSANRKGKPNLCTPKKLDNKIKLIESIIELLPTDKQERAKDEVSILKKIYEAEYQ